MKTRTAGDGRRRRRGRGAVAVEFALLLPILLALVLGIMDYGWYFFCRLTCTNAAREGARAGTTVPYGDSAKAQQTALNYISNAGLGAQSTVVNAVVDSSPTKVSVDISMHFQPLVGFVTLPSDGAGPVATAHAVMMGVP